MSGGEIAALVVAAFWAVLVVVLAVVLLKLGGVLDEAGKLVHGVADQTVPLIGELTSSVVHVNDELSRLDTITANVQSVTGNVSALTAVVAATAGGPLVKVAAFSYGVRHALTSGPERAERRASRRRGRGRRGRR